ncbi:MAG: hypothetical protein AAFY28_07905 [Actinomycetota bacterium]
MPYAVELEAGTGWMCSRRSELKNIIGPNLAEYSTTVGTQVPGRH